MLESRPLRPHEIHLWSVDLDVPVRPNCYPEVLSPDEWERAGRLRSSKHRSRWIASRTALRQILSIYTGVRPAELEFKCDTQGKPFLKRCSKAGPPQFNLSHCQNLSVVAVTNAASIGVDIEQVRVVPEAEDIAKNFFSDREYHEFIKMGETERSRGFLAAWTRKEACLKALGSGLSTALSHFEVSFDNCCSPQILAVGGSTRDARNWSLYDFSPIDGFVGAIAIQYAIPLMIVRRSLQ